MRPLRSTLLVFVVVSAVAAQAPDQWLSDTRLSVHTLVREDVFARFRNNNMERLSNAEQNIEILLKARPDQRANLLAWKAGASTVRAVLAHESGQADEFRRHYAEALEGFAAAAKLESGNDGVAARNDESHVHELSRRGTGRESAGSPQQVSRALDLPNIAQIQRTSQDR
jgi:hypothetical protein